MISVKIPFISVIASFFPFVVRQRIKAWQSRTVLKYNLTIYLQKGRDCFVAAAPRNDKKPIITIFNKTFLIIILYNSSLD